MSFRLRALCRAAVFALLAMAAASVRAQSELASGLSAPPAEAGVLEIATVLAPPPPSGGAARIAPMAPAPAAHGAADRPFAPTSLATRESPARVDLLLAGPLGNAMRSVAATDLAYVPELRLETGGDYVLQGHGARAGGAATATLVLRHADGTGGTYRAEYAGPEAGLTAFVHRFIDDAVEKLTGLRSAFRSELVFSRRLGRGRKGIFVVDADGANLHMVAGGDRIATLPAFGAGAIWYSIATPSGVFITRTGANDQPIVGAPGTNMGVQVCGDRLVFAAARGGAGGTDIYTAALDGTDERRLTMNTAIDVSPTCAPNGTITFVSDRSGRPALWSIGRNGGTAHQLTREGESQTPCACQDARRSLVAYTAVGNGMRVMTLDTATGETRRISPDFGTHKDPAFSPDCRLIAWVTAAGIMVAAADGRLPRLIARGHAETVRWARGE